MKRILLSLCALLLSFPALAQDKATPEQIEFFERKVRPVLVEHCYECHSAKAKRIKGGFRLDSRAGMLEGGDLGPALVPGQPEKSRLVEAISHKNAKLKMPQKYKLPDAVIADLTAWVKVGAAWPDEKLVKKSTYSEFDLAKRKQDHWCWQPIANHKAPVVTDRSWPRSDVDRFLLHKLEAKQMKPAADADLRTLIRRVYFDLLGLPPSRDDVEAFVKEANANRQAAFEKVVDRLLDSPQFGERWARHWLDLVRYAESRGHEFDYTIPNAYHYRDYVIRAFNEDVPYNQFVHEHLAGDLLKNPRMSRRAGSVNDRSAPGFNESILGTAFWFLGEECHSPVDIRQDQADRFDNRIDVMTKTFLGLTVACARCHDHKFDAISTKDYYALFGILESSNYRLARFDTFEEHRKIAAELAQLRDKSRESLLAAIGQALVRTVDKTDAYLVDAVGRPQPGIQVDAVRAKKWRRALDEAAKDPRSPLYAFAIAAAKPVQAPKETLAPILKQTPISNVLDLKNADVIIEYRSDKSVAWMADDMAFGLRPMRVGDVILGSSPQQPIARMVEHAAVERDRAWDGIKLTANTQNESGALGSAARAGRTWRTPEFTLKSGAVQALVKGNGMVYAAVAQHIMLAGPLHGSLVQKFNTGDRYQWVTVQLPAYKGQRLHLEFTPSDKSDFGIIAVIHGSTAPPITFESADRSLLEAAAEQGDLAALSRQYAIYFKGIALAFSHDDARLNKHALAANWLLQHLDLFFAPDEEEGKHVARIAGPILEQHKKLLAQITPESRLAPAMQDGSGVDENVFIRGNPKTPGELVKRRFLEAFVSAKPMPIERGSGRVELAKQMTDPAITPLITRVYVNRIWHHLFGRGIVASTDNFGVLGEAPTHPELLDYVAHQFATGDGWSTKKLIRSLVLSRAYQMASTPDAKADEADPANLLLHRMRIRRLEGEAIRDSILKVSGRLNAKMYGPSIPVNLTPFQDGRGKPASGPLDGDGRRSVYLAVRRNFLSSFLLAFDTPAPFSTVGRRTVSNVPAQALILMNDPFVHQQAEVWGKLVAAEEGSTDERVRGMYIDAFARPPSQKELTVCQQYLGAAPDASRWGELAHVLINAKEFSFIH